MHVSNINKKRKNEVDTMITKTLRAYFPFGKCRHTSEMFAGAQAPRHVPSLLV